MLESPNLLYLPWHLIYLCQSYVLYFRVQDQPAWKPNTFMRSNRRGRGLLTRSFSRFVPLFWPTTADRYSLERIDEQRTGRLCCAIATRLHKVMLRMVLNCLYCLLLQIDIPYAIGWPRSKHGCTGRYPLQTWLSILAPPWKLRFQGMRPAAKRNQRIMYAGGMPAAPTWNLRR